MSVYIFISWWMTGASKFTSFVYFNVPKHAMPDYRQQGSKTPLLQCLELPQNVVGGTTANEKRGGEFSILQV
jgi:hypothetical protein